MPQPHPLDNETLRIHSLESFGTHDGPGIRFIIFTQGCEFLCAYCHNPDTISKTGGHDEPMPKIARLICNQKEYFGRKGGLTVSGGEPLLHRHQLLKLFKYLKSEGVHIALDTNGRVMDQAVRELLKYVDLVLLDVKHIDSEKHRKLTGVPNEPVLEFADYLRSIGKKIWLRYVYVPQWTDDEQDLERWAKHFGDFENIERVEILPYHRLGVHKWEQIGWEYRLKDVPLPTEENLINAKSIFDKYFKDVRVN